MSEESSSRQNHSKGFLESFSSKSSFYIGLIAGILIICTVGFFVLLGVTLNGKGKTADANVNTNGNAVANNNQPSAPANPDTTTPKVTSVAKPSSSDHIRGSLKAKVIMIEYSDFQCPYCQMLHPTLKKLVDDYNGQVAWVYRSFPLESLHPFAKKAAEAAECANDQGRFWDYADKLYENQQLFSDSYFADLAGQLGLNMQKFNDCLSTNKYQSKIQASEAEAAAAGITGTPGVFVNDQFVRGAMPYENFKQIIDGLLK